MRILGEVEAVQRCVAGASIASEDEPGFFSSRPGVEELELGVRDATIVGIHGGWLRPVAMANDLDEALTGVDLVAKDLAEVAGSVPKIS